MKMMKKKAEVEVVEETGEAAEVGRVDELRKGEAEEGSGKAVLGDLVRDVQVVDVLVGAERVEGVRRHAEDGEPAVLKKTGVGALRAQGREGFEEARGRANVKVLRDR